MGLCKVNNTECTGIPCMHTAAGTKKQCAKYDEAPTTQQGGVSNSSALLYAKKLDNALPLLEYIVERMTYKTTPKWLRWRIETALNILKDGV